MLGMSIELVKGDIMNLKKGIEQMIKESNQPNVLKDFVMDKIFGNEDLIKEVKENPSTTPYLFKKGDKVRFGTKPYKDFTEDKDDFEVIGFYKDGEVVDENTASPYSKSYGVRVRNLKNGKEYPTTRNFLERVE